MVKKVYVEAGLLKYQGVSEQEATSKLENEGYIGIELEVTDDTTVVLIWHPMFMVSEEDIKKKVIEYFEYVHSITGMPVPEINWVFIKQGV